MARSSAKSHGRSVMVTENDKFREECGLFGVWSSEDDAAHLAFFGLHALQHRGQESAGLAVAANEDIKSYKAMGLVTKIFSEDKLEQMRGKLAIGHVRYSTTGASLLVNAQPLVIRSHRGSMALAHNGNLTNSHQLRRELEEAGAIFHSTLDTEIIAHLIAHSGKKDFEEALLYSLQRIKGAYSLLVLTAGVIYGIRDPHGFRPLILGRLNGDYMLASESCAFHIAGGDPIREVEPGEIVVIKEGQIRSFNFTPPRERRFCIFEYIYFARPDSTFGNTNVHLARRQMGKQLAREYGVAADVVIPVPDSGVSAAQGFAEASGISFQLGLIKNKYVGRTFILPRQSLRDLQVKLKLSPVREIIEGKRVVLIDDSIVRGTTSRQIVKMVREVGAREVHLGICSPPVTNSCFYGLDTTDRKELIASRMGREEICRRLGADSLCYLSLAGLWQSLGEEGFCDACFSGKYPIAGNCQELIKEGPL